MPKHDQIDRSLKPKPPISRNMHPVGRTSTQTATSVRNQQPMASATMSRPYRPDHRQPSGSYQPPMLQRWLDEGKHKEDGKVRDRDEYPKGGAGMSRYLVDWDLKFRDTEEKAGGGRGP